MADTKFVISAEDRTQAAFNSAVGGIKSLNGAIEATRAAALGIFGGAVISGLSTGTKAIIDTRIEYERLRNILGQAVGIGRVGEEFDFVRAQAAKLGLEFNSTALEYARFAAATRGTAVEGAQTREIFTGLAQAAAAMGMSSEQSAGALNALQQMISKGKVSAEELRGQLGERLPGAFQIAARSMGVTTQELDAMLQAGTVLADDFLPRFAKQLQSEFGEAATRAADSTQAAVNRITNAWNDLKRTVATGEIGKGIAQSLDPGAAALEKFNAYLRDSARLGADLSSELMRVIMLRGTLGRINPMFGNVLEARKGDILQQGREAQAELDRESNRTRMAPAPRITTQADIRAIDDAALARLGVDARKRLEDIRKQNRTDAQKLKEEISQIRADALLTGTDPTQLIAAAQARANRGSASKAESEATRARKRALEEAKQEAQAIEQVRQQAMGFDPSFAENARRLYQAHTEGPELARLSVEQYTKAYLELIQTQTAGGQQMKEADDARKERIEEDRQRLVRQMEDEQRVVDSARQSAEAIAERAQAMRDENDTAGLSASAIERIRIARQQEYVEIARVSGVSMEYIKQVEAEIEARKRLADEMDRKGEIDRAADAQKKLRDESTRTAEHTQQAISNAIFRAFQDGDFTAKKFAKLLQATFAEVVLRPQLEIASKAGSKAIEGILGAVVAGIRGYASSTAPVTSNGWVSAEGGMDYGGLASKSMSAITPAMTSIAQPVAAPNVTVHQTLYTDARSDVSVIQSAMVQAKNAAVAEVGRQFGAGGPLQRMR